MPLSAGSRLGPYEIVAPLGSGGMGEVYRAHDPRMGRDVAVKIVAEQFSDRLSREVHAVAALNHPSICTIHDVGPDYIVMELIEGPTLAEKIVAGLRAEALAKAGAGSREPGLRAEALAKAGAGIPLSEVLPIARQIAEALEAAHAKGIVHRDLKPANVMLKDGVTVKVLDFGLAKAGDPGAGSREPGAGEPGADLANSPTMMSPAVTQAGIILGTAAYMAPEQARGKPIDKRADIWAFGCVLYEMLTGRRPFGGDEVSDTLAFIITKEPDWAALPADTPAAIRRMLKRCLQKNPHDRLHDIADARIEIVEVLATPDLETRTPVTAALPMWRRALPWTVAALGVILAAATIATRPATTPPAASMTHFTIPLPEGTVPAGGGIAVSTDGAQIAFSGGPGRQIFVRAMEQTEVKPIAGTEGATFLSFSPDGRWISYVDSATPGQLRKVPTSGGASQILAPASRRGGPPVQTWAPDNTILFSHDGVLMRIAATGGTPQTLARPDEKSYFFIGHLLPGGREALVNSPVLKAVAVDLKTLATRNLANVTELPAGLVQFAASSGTSPLGHLVSYDSSAGTLVAVPFDTGTLQVRGSPARVLEGVQSAVGPFGSFAFSDSGTLAYVSGSAGMVPESTMVWVDRSGTEQPLAAAARRYSSVRLSPDTARVAAGIAEGSPEAPTNDVWAYDLARGTLTRVTFDEQNWGHAWMPDARNVVSLSMGRKDRRLELRSAAIDGTTSTAVMSLEKSDIFVIPSSISPDGKTLIGIQPLGGGGNSLGGAIMVVPLGGAVPGDARPVPLSDSRFLQRDAVFSADGRFVAYQSNESGRDEVHVVTYPKLDGKWQVSVDGGTAPRWAANGRELFYRNGDKMMAVDVQTTPTFRPGAPRVLFEGRYRPFAYDVSPDGQRFLMLKAVSGQERPTELHVIVNWFEELRRKAPLPK